MLSLMGPGKGEGVLTVSATEDLILLGDIRKSKATGDIMMMPFRELVLYSCEKGLFAPTVSDPTPFATSLLNGMARNFNGGTTSPIKPALNGRAGK